MRALWLPDLLADFGLKVNEIPGWQMRGSSSFEPEGVIVHHTAAPKGKDAPSLRICVEGRADLPGPLCNVLLSRSGVCHVVASGRSNHAGRGNWQGYTGNARFLGIEAENDGISEPWSPELMDAFHRATAACLAGIDAPPVMCAGHKEYAQPKGRKSDPRFDMPEFRAAVGLDLQWWRMKKNGDDDDMTPEQDARLTRLEDKVDKLANSVAGFATLPDGKRDTGRRSLLGRIGDALKVG